MIVNKECHDRPSERKLRFLTETVPLIVWTTGANGSCDHVSRRWCVYTGRPAEDALGLGWLESVHPEDRDRYLDRAKLAARTGANFELEYRLRRADGTYRWFLARVGRLSEGGWPARWLGTATDIDDRKRMEEALREADRRKDDFLAMLAHEIRNFLGPIRNALAIMRVADGNLAATDRARDTLDRQVAQVARLVDDLLDVSRIGRGKVQLRVESCDLAQVVRQTAEDYRGALAARGVRMDVRLPTGPVWVHGDPDRLVQVLTNGLQNAGKFTDTDGTVTVTLDADQGVATLRIRDTGVGMGPDALRHAFEPFAQAEQTRARSGGLGLGLTLVKGLVEAHGGTVSAASDGPGRGTEVVVRLPLGPDPSLAPDAHPSADLSPLGLP